MLQNCFKSTKTCMQSKIFAYLIIANFIYQKEFEVPSLDIQETNSGLCKTELDTFNQDFSESSYELAKKCLHENWFQTDKKKFNFKLGFLEFNNPNATPESLELANKYMKEALKHGEKEAELYINTLEKNKESSLFVQELNNKKEDRSEDSIVELIQEIFGGETKNSLLTLKKAAKVVKTNCAQTVLFMGKVGKETVASLSEKNVSGDDVEESLLFLDQDNPKRSLEEFLKTNNSQQYVVVNNSKSKLSKRTKKSLVSFHRMNAAQGNSRSQFLLGHLQQAGAFEFPQNTEAAERHFQQAAERNSPEALNSLAQLRFAALQTQEDTNNRSTLEQETLAAEGMNYLLRAAEQNDPLALYNLGIIYLHGLYLQEKEENMGLKTLALSAVLGKAEAFYQIGTFLANNQEKVNSFSEEETEELFASLSALETVLGPQESKQLLKGPVFYFKKSHELGDHNGTYTYAMYLAFPGMRGGAVGINDIKEMQTNNTNCKEAVGLLTQLLEKNEYVLRISRHADRALVAHNFSAALLNYTLLAKLGMYNATNNVVGLLRVLEETCSESKGVFRVFRFLRFRPKIAVSEHSFVGQVARNKKLVTRVLTSYLRFMSTFDKNKSTHTLGDVLMARGKTFAAFESYIAAAETGNARSAFSLAWLYANGTAVERNLAEADKFVQLSIKNGGGNAALFLKAYIRFLQGKKLLFSSRRRNTNLDTEL